MGVENLQRLQELVLENNAVNATKVVVAAGVIELSKMVIENPNTVDSFIQIFNKLTADVTIGTTSPDATFLIPGGTSATLAGAFDRSWSPDPWRFNIGLVIAITTLRDNAVNPTNACAAKIWKRI